MKPILTGLRLFPVGWMLCALIAMAATASAQEKLDANWIVGKWQGELRSQSGGRSSPMEFRVKADGTFEGDVQTPSLGNAPFLDGKWDIAGDTATFKYRLDVVGSRGRLMSNSTWTMMREGEDLEGTGINNTTSLQFSGTFKRAK